MSVDATQAAQSSMRGRRPTRVLVVQRRLTHYRIPLFEALRDALARERMALTLLVGDPTEAERQKNDEGHLAWAEYAPCTYLMGGRICWQDARPWVARSDLVVLTQENKLVQNIPLLLGNRRNCVGLWGHGRNFQARDSLLSAPSQAIKAWLSRRPGWWFAYTEMSADVIRGFGYPAERITVLNNSIDTTSLEDELVAARGLPRSSIRDAFGIADGPLGVFVGSLYSDKRLDLLLDGAQLVRKAYPTFQLAIAGAGPDDAWLRNSVARLPWIHVLGSVRGERKAQLLAAADLMLNPGLVGLGILDSFVAGLPMVTTDCRLHSPEIAYLQNGRNGLMTAPNPVAFASGVESILADDHLKQRLQRGCRDSAMTYGIDAMVRRFCQGLGAWCATMDSRT